MRVPIAYRHAASSGGVDVVAIEVRGGVSEPDRADAEAAIRAVLARHRHAAGQARVRVSGSTCGGPGLVQVNLRVCGAPARVQVPGPTVAAAVSSAASRLDRQVTRLTTAWEDWPWPDPQRRPLGIPGVGRIVRRKRYRLHAGLPCQAAAILHAMDYEVFLYHDVETGEDAVVYRAGPVGITLARQATMSPPMRGALPLTVNPRKVPTLSAAQAARRLADGWLPFVFYTDEESGRGNLLYRRYDGDLGLIAPASDGAR